MTEPEGKASVVHLLGECGDIVGEAPYSLEKLIDSYDEIKDASVKIALLTSTIKLFFKRPPEVQKMLGRLLAKATEDVSSQDLHDRALMYYRLLSTAGDPKIVEQVVSKSPVIGGHGVNFAEEEDKEHRDALLEEFNTLSTLYGITSENFISEEYQVKLVRMPKEHPLDVGAAPLVDPGVNGVAEHLQQTSINDVAPESAPAAPAAPALSGEVDLLGFGLGDGPMVAPTPAAASSDISLDASFKISGEDYQAKWEAVADSHALSVMMSLRLQPESTDLVESALSTLNILTMASGELPTELKFFLYGRERRENGMIFLIQAVIFKSPDLSLSITIKTSGGDQARSGELSQKVVDMMKTALQELM
uniref:Beta-adaptin appendage C-terminal subdomain domain-containing protein n=1 Tax=Ditylum brightwellii TaxID=49249 RepID=A0A6V2IVW9_9STRA